MNTELWDINQLIGYRDAHWDIWIDFSRRNITKQAVVHHTFMAFWIRGCLISKIAACSSQVA